MNLMPLTHPSNDHSFSYHCYGKNVKMLIFSDMENPASVQAMLADICVEKCGHFAVKQEITTKMSYYGQILRNL